MLNTSQVWKSSPLRLLVFFLLTGATIGLCDTLFAADVQCRFKAKSEATEIHIVLAGKTLWASTIESLRQKSYPFLRGRLPLYLRSIIRISRPREMFDQTAIHKFAEIKRSLFRFFMKPKSIEVPERRLSSFGPRAPHYLWPVIAACPR